MSESRSLTSLAMPALFRDRITGLLIRPLAEVAFKVLLERDADRSLPLSVLMAGVDDVKVRNDLLGHTAGDEALAFVAAAIAGAVPRQTMPYSLGGDGFLVILPMTDDSALEHVADDVLLAVRSVHLGKQAGFERLSVSLGGSTLLQLPEEPRSSNSEPPYQRVVSQLLFAAGRALGSSKRAGKDRYTFRECELDGP